MSNTFHGSYQRPMNLRRAIRTCFEKFADFQGRAGRPEYWYFALFCLLLDIAGSIISFLSGYALGTQIPGDIFQSVSALAVCIPAVAVSIRRLHDLDKSGWWSLINFIPLIGFVILIYWSSQSGTTGPNRFGSDPVISRG